MGSPLNNNVTKGRSVTLGTVLMESHDSLAVSFDAEVQDMCILSHEGSR
jgi:hypothetical protein